MTILDTPTYRNLVQDNLITAKFEAALFPKLLFRSEAKEEEWGDQTGDSKVFTGNGLIAVTTAEIQPLADPEVAGYGREQWTAQMRKFGKSIDTHTPTSAAAAVKLMVEDVEALGKNAGQTINRICRLRLFNAALSGNTVVDGASGPSATVRLKRLNGFTRARRPDLVAGSPVRFDTVSASNPLPIKWGNTLANSNTVIGFTPDFPGDEIGPGTVTLASAVTVADRDAFVADTATYIRRSGGGNRIDDLGASDVLVFADLRAVLARLANMDVPMHADGFYHGHMSPISKNQIFADNEWQRLQESLPDGLAYSEFTIGKKLGCVWYENNENPQLHNVNIPNGSTDGATGDQYTPLRESFAGELFPNGTPTAAAGKVQRVLVTGGEFLREYYVDQDSYITEAGVNGKISEMPRTGSGSVQLMAQRIKLIQRAPQDRLQEIVSQSWRFVGDFVARTDAATGDGRYIKRAAAVEHIEP
jgi:hypothetical protein